jgi:hypothetical protein
VTVTRHAVERFGERGRTVAAAHVIDKLRALVMLAIEEDRLLEVGDGSHLVPIRGPRGWLCLVVGIDGPRLKPYAVVVYTVLTWAMAIETFGHVAGLIRATCGQPSTRTA